MDADTMENKGPTPRVQRSPANRTEEIYVLWRIKRTADHGGGTEEERLLLLPVLKAVDERLRSLRVHFSSGAC